MRNAYRESAPKPPPTDWSDVDAYLRKLQKRHARWEVFYGFARMFEDAGPVLIWGLVIIGTVIGIVALSARNQEKQSTCRHKGGTWVQTWEGDTGKCLDIREIEVK
jgi:hypothetical protein